MAQLLQILFQDMSLDNIFNFLKIFFFLIGSI